MYTELINFLWPIAIKLTFGATVLLLAVTIVNLFLFRAAPSLRHRIWTFAVKGSLFFLICCFFLPRLSLTTTIAAKHEIEMKHESEPVVPENSGEEMKNNGLQKKQRLRELYEQKVQITEENESAVKSQCDQGHKQGTRANYALARRATLLAKIEFTKLVMDDPDSDEKTIAEEKEKLKTLLQMLSQVVQEYMEAVQAHRNVGDPDYPLNKLLEAKQFLVDTEIMLIRELEEEKTQPQIAVRDELEQMKLRLQEEKRNLTKAMYDTASKVKSAGPGNVSYTELQELYGNVLREEIALLKLHPDAKINPTIQEKILGHYSGLVDVAKRIYETTNQTNQVAPHSIPYEELQKVRLKIQAAELELMEYKASMTQQ